MDSAAVIVAPQSAKGLVSISRRLGAATRESVGLLVFLFFAFIRDMNHRLLTLLWVVSSERLKVVHQTLMYMLALGLGISASLLNGFLH